MTSLVALNCLGDGDGEIAVLLDKARNTMAANQEPGLVHVKGSRGMLFTTILKKVVEMANASNEAYGKRHAGKPDTGSLAFPEEYGLVGGPHSLDQKEACIC